ncbi:hypothetical protein LJB86_05000, partial [Deltaproteobacteria bacterium OttesenSCG-928-M10]|nr:hypothetical protein [Deltaproteobacteria bacterium OttesenSCG-928-M10]
TREDKASSDFSTFPDDGREELAYKAVAAMMRDFPDQTFPVICRASWFLTNVENCKALLPATKRAAFMRALNNAGLTEKFPDDQKIRFWKIERSLSRRGVTFRPIGERFSIPDGFDFRDAPDLTKIAPYLFEAVQRLESQNGDQTIITKVTQNISQQVEITEKAA